MAHFYDSNRVDSVTRDGIYVCCSEHLLGLSAGLI